MTTDQGVDVVPRHVTTSLGVFLVVAMAVLRAAPAHGETAPPSDVSFFDEARRLQLTGQLYRPDGPGPFAAIVMLHGCGGVQPPQHDWGRRLRAWGYMALLVDSFSTRGKTRICDDFLGVDPRFARMPDAYAAKSWLGSQPLVDRRRIALIGWSHGGAATLFAVDDIYLSGIRSTPFAAAIAFYPWCHSLFQRVNTPLLILIGEDDEITAASECRKMLRSTQQWEPGTAANITLKVYPGAHHGFDQREPLRQRDGQTIGRHPTAAVQAEGEVKRFLARYLSNG